MYIRYLNKLCDLHVELQNYTEAAFALKLHAHLLKVVIILSIVLNFLS